MSGLLGCSFLQLIVFTDDRSSRVISVKLVTNFMLDSFHQQLHSLCVVRYLNVNSSLPLGLILNFLNTFPYLI